MKRGMTRDAAGIDDVRVNYKILADRAEARMDAAQTMADNLLKHVVSQSSLLLEDIAEIVGWIVSGKYTPDEIVEMALLYVDEYETDTGTQLHFDEYNYLDSSNPTKHYALEVTLGVRRARLKAGVIESVISHVLAMHELGFFQQVYDVQAETGIAFDPIKLDTGRYEGNTAIHAETVRGYIDKAIDALFDSLKKLATDVIDNDDTTGAIEYDIEEEQEHFDLGAKRMVKTATTDAIVGAQSDALKAMDQSWYMYLTERDDKVCEACARLDGKKFQLSQARPGENMPALHLNCRCTIVVSITKDGLAELAKLARRPNGKHLRWKTIPSYDEWLEAVEML